MVIKTKNGNYIVATPIGSNGRIGFFSKNGKFIRITNSVEFAKFKKFAENGNAVIFSESDKSIIDGGREVNFPFPEWGEWQFLGKTRDGKKKDFIQFRFSQKGNLILVFITVEGDKVSFEEKISLMGKVRFQYRTQLYLDFPISYKGRRYNLDFSLCLIVGAKRIQKHVGGKYSANALYEKEEICNQRKTSRDSYFTDEEKFSQNFLKKEKRALQNKDSPILEKEGLRFFKPPSSKRNFLKVQDLLSKSPHGIISVSENISWKYSDRNFPKGSKESRPLLALLVDGDKILPTFEEGRAKNRFGGKEINLFGLGVKKEVFEKGVLFFERDGWVRQCENNYYLLTSKESGWVQSLPNRLLTTIRVIPLKTESVLYKDLPEEGVLEGNRISFQNGSTKYHLDLCYIEETHEVEWVLSKEGLGMSKKEEGNIVLPKIFYAHQKVSYEKNVRIFLKLEYKIIFAWSVNIESTLINLSAEEYPDFSNFLVEVNERPWYSPEKAITEWCDAHLRQKADTLVKEVDPAPIFWDPLDHGTKWSFQDNIITLKGILKTERLFGEHRGRFRCTYPEIVMTFDMKGHLIKRIIN